MKKVILTLVTILTTTINLLSQEDNIWVRIPNYENNKTIVSELLQNQNVISIEKAVPSSRTPRLQELYQINCNCDVNELLVVTSKRHDIFVNPEIGPKYETLGLPNDYNLSVPYDYALNLIKAEGAWAITEGDSSIIIGISDAGYYMDNAELFPKYVSGDLNFNMSNPGHGTAVATTAAGHTNNSFGKSSIGYKSSLDLRMMNYNGLLEASYAGARVINASWAAGCYFSQYGQDIINEIYNNGSIVVAAAGNGSTCGGAGNYVYPASYDHVISVTSVGPYYNHERFMGNPSSTHQHNNNVDLCAPGYDVYVTTTNGSFLPATGSSFASPQVSGTVALMLSVNPCLTFEQVEYILKSTADTIVNTVNPQYVGGLGSGLLDASKAVEMAMKTKTFNVVTTIGVNCELSSKQITISEFYGEAPYTIEWSNGQTGPVCDANVPGLYTLKVIDSEGCRFYEEIEISEYNEMVVEPTKHNVTCNGASNGMIDLDVTGGEPNYSFIWSNGDTTSSINNLPMGTYSVTITDYYGCSKTKEITIDEPNVLESSLTYTEPTGNVMGSIDLTVNGGTQPYTYQWYSSNGNYTTEDLNDIPSDFYEVLITDANGCTTSENIFLNNVVNTASVNEIFTSDIKVYPNPSNGNFTIDNYVGDITIMDMNGRILVETMVDGSQNFNNIPTGMYLIKTKTSITKMIVNK